MALAGRSALEDGVERAGEQAVAFRSEDIAARAFLEHSITGPADSMIARVSSSRSESEVEAGPPPLVDVEEGDVGGRPRPVDARRSAASGVQLADLDELAHGP